MDAHTKIAGWIDSITDDLDLRLTTLSWVNTWVPGYFSIIARIKIDGVSYEGFGTDRDADLAVMKAVVEAIERSVKDKMSFPTSSGIAGHSDRILAARSAFFELIERDAFFCHYLTQTPIAVAVDSQEVLQAKDIPVDAILSNLKKAGVTLKFGDLVAPDGVHVVICAALGNGSVKPFGTIIGLGCEEDRGLAFRKAALECLTNVAAFLDGNMALPMSAEEFAAHPWPGVDEHLRLALDLKSGKIMDSLLSRPAHATCTALDVSDLEIQELSMPDALSTAPLYFARVTSARAQQAFFGRLERSFLNMERLQTFCGKQLTQADIQCHPHPLA